MRTLLISQPDLLYAFILGVIVVTTISVGGWVWTTRLRIKHGYPLTDGWGRRMEPRLSSETMERIAILDTDNAQLRAELASAKDRLAVVERIVTDRGHQVSAEIERLRAVR